MRIAFRVDSSLDIGTGHWVRCQTLAHQLRERGAAVEFVCRDLPGHSAGPIESEGFRLGMLPAPFPTTSSTREKDHRRWLGVPWEIDAEQTAAILKQGEPPVDWLIVDHYAIDNRWESRLRSVATRIMVIDDLADRPHDCDLLHDHNYFPDAEARYADLIPARTPKLLGPRYALLRPEFRKAGQGRPREPLATARLFVFMGGADPHNVTSLVLDSLSLPDRPPILADVVITSANPHAEEVEARTAGLPWVRLHRQVRDMASLMAEADLAVGGGGVTAWERCLLGLPTIIVIMAENQVRATEALAEAGAALNAGHFENMTPANLAATVRHLLTHPSEARAIGQKASALMGEEAFLGAEYVAQRLLHEAGLPAGGGIDEPREFVA